MLVNQYHKAPTVWCFITPIYGEVGGGLGFLLTLLLYQHNMCWIQYIPTAPNTFWDYIWSWFLGCHTPSQMVFGAPRYTYIHIYIYIIIYISLSLPPHQSTNLSIYYLSISFYIFYLFFVLICSNTFLWRPSPTSARPHRHHPRWRGHGRHLQGALTRLLRLHRELRPGRSGAPGGRHLPRGVGHGPGQKVCWDEKIGSNRRFYRFFLELTRDFNWFNVRNHPMSIINRNL